MLTAQTAEWWRGAVIYQIYPRSFADSNGDGIGDLPGIVSQLDHLASLGVDGIWLSPFFRSPMKDFGYDISDYCDVDPVFGTLDDFRRLLREAHARGLKVIIDQVYSHTSDKHPWFEESRADRVNPKADWYIWADAKPDGTAPNNWMAAFGGVAWTWDTRRRQYYFHNFLPEQPDLDVSNPDVQEAILAAARFWLETGVDGFRLDVANYFMQDKLLRDNPPRPGHASNTPLNFQQHVYNKSRPENLVFIERLRGEMNRYPGRMSVAEIKCDRNLERMAEYTSGGNRLHTAYSFHLLGPEFGAKFLRAAVEDFFAEPGSPWPAWAFSNHDVPRAPSRWGSETPAFAEMLLALLVSLRGTIFLYQGEELGLPQSMVPREHLRDPEGINNWPRHRNRDGARTPMPWRKTALQPRANSAEPWLPVEPRHLPLAIDVQQDDRSSTLHFTRMLLAWRRRHPVFQAGGIRFFDLPEPLLGFARFEDGAGMAAVFNLGPEPVTLETGPVSLEPISCSDADGGELKLPGRGFAFFPLPRAGWHPGASGPAAARTP